MKLTPCGGLSAFWLLFFSASLCDGAVVKRVRLRKGRQDLESGDAALNSTLASSDYISIFSALRRDVAEPAGQCSLMGGLVLPKVSARCCFSIQVATQRGLSEYGMGQPCKGAWRCQADGVTPEQGFEEQARKEVCAEPSCLAGVTTAMKSSWKTAKAAKFLEPMCDVATISVENGTKDGLIRASFEGMDVASMRPAMRRRRRRKGSGKKKKKPMCFPGEALVQVLGRGVAPIASLKAGELVLTAQPKVGALPEYEPVLDWIHIAKGAEASFVTIHHEHGILRASPGHLVFADSASDRGHIIDVPAGNLRKDDVLFVVAGTDFTANGLVTSKVLAIDTSVSVGMYAPLTHSGMIVVDGVLASNYATPSLELKLPHWLAHAGLFPVRAFHSLGLAYLLGAAQSALWGSEDIVRAEVSDVMHPYFSFLYHGLRVDRLLQSA